MFKSTGEPIEHGTPQLNRRHWARNSIGRWAHGNLHPNKGLIFTFFKYFKKLKIKPLCFIASKKKKSPSTQGVC